MTTPDSLTGLSDRYYVQEHLGSGAFGSVFRAYDTVLQRSVALKVLERVGNDTVDSVLDEARALAAVDSAYVVRVMDQLLLTSARVVVMEFISGGSLEHQFLRGVRLPIPLALSVCRAIACGLADIHTAKLLHCDLKPANILMPTSGGARIADFGLARHHDLAPLMPAGGSLGYVAPEVLQGSAPTPAADVYSAGVIMWELLSGQRAFSATQTMRVLGQQLTMALPQLSTVSAEVPAELRALIHQALQVEPELRPTAAMLADEFERRASGRAPDVRNLRGLGIVVVVPCTLMALVAMLWVWTWAIPTLMETEWGRFSGSSSCALDSMNCSTERRERYSLAPSPWLWHHSPALPPPS